MECYSDLFSIDNEDKEHGAGKLETHTPSTTTSSYVTLTDISYTDPSIDWASPPKPYLRPHANIPLDVADRYSNKHTSCATGAAESDKDAVALQHLEDLKSIHSDGYHTVYQSIDRSFDENSNKSCIYENLYDKEDLYGSSERVNKVNNGYRAPYVEDDVRKKETYVNIVSVTPSPDNLRHLDNQSLI